MKRGSVFLFFLIILLSPCFCKRTAPKEVPSIVVHGIEFRVAHFYVSENNTVHNGGIIEVYDYNTNTKIDTIVVYTTEYSSVTEKDVQDVYIIKMKLLNSKTLQITNEKRQVFEINIEKYTLNEVPNEEMV